MNEYIFEEINCGHEESFNVKISQEDILNFSNISGDKNPLHLDDNYSKKTKFKRPVVYGMLVQSYVSTLAGMYLPGKYSLILSTNLNNKKPCYVNDEIVVCGKVKSKLTFGNILVLDIKMTNQNNEVVVSGDMKVQVLK